MSNEMNWLNFIEDSKPLCLFFDGEIPSLKNIDLFNIKFCPQDKWLYLDFDLNEWPSKAPKKWNIQKFNTTRVSLLFSRALDITMTGNFSAAKVEIKLKKRENFNYLTVLSDSFSLELQSDAVFLSEVSAYQQ